MRRSKYRSAWGLALAVLFGTAAAKADPGGLPPLAMPATINAGSPLPPVAPPPPPVGLNAPAAHPSFPPPGVHSLPPAPVHAGNPANSAPTGGFSGAHNTGGHDHGNAKKEHGGVHGDHAKPAEHGNAHGNGHGNAHGGGHGEAHHEEEDHNKIIAIGEYLLIRPRRREQDYAILGRNPNWGPIGDIKSVEGGFDSGGRVGVGYHFCGGYEAAFLYTHYHTAGDDQIPLSLTQQTGLQLFPTLTHPSTVTEVTAAKAENNINLNLFDTELGKRWKAGEGMTLRAFAGPRFLNLDQKYLATYTGRDVGNGSDVVRRNLLFDGIGLRAGGEVNYHFWEFLGVYARGSGSMVTGRFRSSLTEVANGQTIVNVNEKYDKIVPMVDVGLGVSFQKGSWRITAGYEFWNYFGMVEGIDFSDDGHPSKPNRRWADLGFDGVVIRAEMLF